MHSPMDLDELDPAVLEEPASHLDPADLMKLGQLLSVDTDMFGPCWETVANELGFGMEERKDITTRAGTHKKPEGWIMLCRWSGSPDPACRTLLVLQSALQCCHRPDIMEYFYSAVRNMNRVTIHIVVKFPPDLQDNQSRLHRMIHPTDSRTTLEQLLANELDGELTDYDITLPKWAEWNTSARELKGNMVTITRRSPQETRLKFVCGHEQNAVMDDEVSSSTNCTTENSFGFKLNIGPESVKVDNNNDQPAMLSDTDNEGDFYLCMNGPSSDHSIKMENDSFVSAAASANAVSSEMVFPQDTHHDAVVSHCPHDNDPSTLYPTFTRPSPSILPRPWFPQPCCSRPSDPVDVPLAPRSSTAHSDRGSGDYDDFEFAPVDRSPPIGVQETEWQRTLSSSNSRSPANEPFWPPPSCSNPVASGNPSQQPVASGPVEVHEPPAVLGRRVHSSKFIPRARDQLRAARFAGWQGQINMERLFILMSPYMADDGWYVIWWSHDSPKDQDQLVLTITHRGELLHYNIRARAVGRTIHYYLFKSLYRNVSVLQLLEFYKTNPLEVKLGCPVLLRHVVGGAHGDY